ncbi:Tex family protein [Polaribacter tangerinus]|uniref:Tex family protein n=1 Tax=Polaribacter tangerinus TaxID=1920034 RepID=UPI000B4B5E95|nr:Tex family protein [Polaribacter tangerinus]
MQLLQYITQQTQLPETAVKNTISLLNSEATIPFISRYRKEMTGSLDEVAIGEIVKFKDIFETLEKRKKYIIKTLEEQQLLETPLLDKINSTTTLIALEDLYLPYKKKRKTKAATARLHGLEPLAKMLISQRVTNLHQTAKKFISKEVSTTEKALEGARFIIAEWISERTDIRHIVRKELALYSEITTKVIDTKVADEKAQKFKDYFNWREALKRIPSHRLLAIFRAEKEGFIRVKIIIDNELICKKIAQRIISSENDCTIELKKAIKDAYKRLLVPSLENEIRTLSKEKADDKAIAVFAKNLQQLLLGAPLGEKRVLAIDPGFKSGCKLVCLDEYGQLLHNENMYPHAPQNQTLAAIKKINNLVETFKIDAIAIGNGTASRETEAVVKKIHFTSKPTIFVISEAGASVYSASKIAREEFPNFDVTVRGAVSIGRRLQDPLAELVKIDAKSIGVGQYQHDVDQVKLKKSLDNVVESCVNNVGVNINTASASLLSYVAGIGEKTAEKIVAYRNKNGAFTNRNDIKKVPSIGKKAFEQSAGFLRIKNSTNPLDNSGVHPESYEVVKEMAKDLNVNIIDLLENNELLLQIPLKKYCTKNIGLPTLTDIVNELKKPGLDIRGKAKAFSFDQTIKTISDLKIGQILPGIVNNITNFGCFVALGIKESGLIHVSNLSKEFVKDVSSIVQLEQQINVKVIEVDMQRKRIQLALVN